jgi:hypothetical protein
LNIRVWCFKIEMIVEHKSGRVSQIRFSMDRKGAGQAYGD